MLITGYIMSTTKTAIKSDFISFLLYLYVPRAFWRQSVRIEVKTIIYTTNKSIECAKRKRPVTYFDFGILLILCYKLLHSLWEKDRQEASFLFSIIVLWIKNQSGPISNQVWPSVWSLYRSRSRSSSLVAVLLSRASSQLSMLVR